jgi:hypothetical protein
MASAHRSIVLPNATVSSRSKQLGIALWPPPKLINSLSSHTNDGQLLKNFHNELSLPISRILIGSKEIESESSL